MRWPREAPRRDDLTAQGHARLLLIEDGAPPPPTIDCLEDWVRAGTSDVELRARVAGLQARMAAHKRPAPELDGDGVLRHGEKWVSLPPVESRLAGVLLDRFGAVVSRDTLSRAGWPTGTSGRNALDVHILRLRRRLHPLALVIKTVRSRGYLLEAAAAHMNGSAKH